MQGLQFIIRQDQISLPNQILLLNQWWKSIHHQLENQDLKMCND